VSPETSIDAAWREGRAAWPTVTVSEPRFAEVAARAAPGDLAAQAADLYLAAACTDGDPVALQLFEQHLLSRARIAIRSIDADAAFVEEACQRLRSRLLVDHGDGKRIATYAGRGSLQGWVTVTAIRTAIMMRRDLRRAREIPYDMRDLGQVAATIAQADPELVLVEQRYAEPFREALRAGIGRLEPRLRAVLQLRYMDNLPLDEIAALYGVHRATTKRWLRRACDSLLASTREILTRDLRLTPSELNWVIMTARSQLDISLSRLLGGPEE
jgi:RNA polymerase sigma-70 factor